MKKKDKILFHYTSLEGLIGIIESKSIWATNVLYLNDASELNYTKRLFKEEISRFCKENPNFKKTKNFDDSVGAIFFDILGDNINRLLDSEILSFYASSFSEEKDQLSQWRGYCHGGSGFNVGFNMKKLRDCVERPSVKIKPCIYDENKQINSLRDLVDKISRQFIQEIKNSSNKADAWNSKSKSLILNFMTEFIQMAPTFKHPKFNEEKEWRIVANFETQKILKAIKFRSGNTMIIPYIKIPLPSVNDNLSIDQIVIGPTHDSILSKKSLELLLKSKGVNCNSICCSDIPYRTE